MTSIVVPAYAKINLTLDVLNRRADGFHSIRSIMQTIALHDTLEVTHTPEKPGVVLALEGEESDGVPTDEGNIVHRAAVRLQKIAAARQTLLGNKSGLHITLTKRVPSQAGLGGGSSDAAAALRAINNLFALDLSRQRLTEIATSLGADVPFFLSGGTALVEGIGETVTPLPPFDTDWHVVIVKPPVGVSTAAAYAALDAIQGRMPGQATASWLAGDTYSAGNDFQDIVLTAYPQIASAHKAMSVGDGPPPLLSGSGAAIFRLVRGVCVAHSLASAVGGKTWITQFQGRNE